MAIALVGTIGAASQGAASAAVTPAWGTSETRAANNLLILFVSVTGSATLPATPSGWTIAKQIAGTTCSASIYYKLAAGADAAPTVAAITSGLIAAQLAEFSGNAKSAPLDQSGSAAGTSSPVTATCGAVDTLAGELIVMCGADFRSTARTPSDTWTSNNATITQAGSNNGVSSVNHYSFGYSLATTAKASASTAVMTVSATQNITGMAVAAATLKLPVVNFLQANTGSFGLTGNAANLRKAELMPAGAGAYAESSNAARAMVSRCLAAGSGSFVETGNAAGLIYTPVAPPTYTMVAGSGSLNVQSVTPSIVLGDNYPSGGSTQVFNDTQGTGQVFVCTKAGKLATAEFDSYRGGNNTGLLVCRIWSVSGGLPNVVLAETSVPVESVAGSGTYGFTFTGTNQINLVAGTTYAITFAYIYTGGTGGFLTLYDSVGTDPIGYKIENDGSGWFLYGASLPATSDQQFRIYVAQSAVTLLRTYNLAPITGAYTLSGNTARLASARSLAGSRGTFTESGSAAAEMIARRMAGSFGTFNETGNTSRMLIARRLVGSVGSYTETGRTASMARAYPLVALPGVYSESGATPWLLRRCLVAATTGSYTESGNTARLLLSRRLVGGLGVYLETGSPADMSKVALATVYNLAALTGSFAVSGGVVSSTDNFNRANGSLGSNWGQVPSPAIALSITSNQLTVTTPIQSGIHCVQFWNGIFNSAQFSQAKVIVPSASGSEGNGVVVRAQSGLDRYYLLYQVGSGLLLFERWDGNYTQLGSNGVAVASGDIIRLEADNSTPPVLTAYKNGISQFSATAIHTTSSGAPGITMVSVGTSVAMDDWQGGNIGVTATAMLVAHRLGGVTGSYTETGNQARLLTSRRLAGNVGAFNVNGGAASEIHRSALGASAGAYTAAGSAARLMRAVKLAIASGNYAETGRPAAMSIARLLAAGRGIFLETGNDAFLFVVGALQHLILIAGTGAFLEAGSSASLLARRMLAASRGLFAEAGASATLLRALKLVAPTGTFNGAGFATLLKFLRLAGGVGVFTEAGASAFFPKGRTASAGSGVFTESGAAASLLRARLLLASAGIYTEIGSDADLTHGDVLVFSDEDICWIVLQLALAVEVSPQPATVCGVHLPLSTAVNVQPELEQLSEIHLPLTTEMLA